MTPEPGHGAAPGHCQLPVQGSSGRAGSARVPSGGTDKQGHLALLVLCVFTQLSLNLSVEITKKTWGFFPPSFNFGVTFPRCWQKEELIRCSHSAGEILKRPRHHGVMISDGPGAVCTGWSVLSMGLCQGRGMESSGEALGLCWQWLGELGVAGASALSCFPVEERMFAEQEGAGPALCLQRELCAWLLSGLPLKAFT